MREPKYEYCAHTWGGFYNEEYSSVHGHTSGFHYFDTEVERKEYVKLLRSVEQDLGACCLMVSEFEGYHCRTEVKCFRISRFEGVDYLSVDTLPPCYGFGNALYWMEHKWYPGLNDYPLGEDFDYDQSGFEVVSEWVEGAFDA